MKKIQFALLLLVCASLQGAEDKVVADGHRVVSRGEWNGYARTVFEFLGCETWIVEPKVEAQGRPWAWIMEWPTAFAKRTGSLALLKAGYHVVTFRPGFYRDGKFESRPGNMNDKRLKESRAFQDYLVSSLGFAPKANLIGMSWGGFYSVRYAATYPDAVAHVYLDAPLLDFSTLKAKGDAFWDLSGKYGVDIKTYVGKDDPRQPVNMYAPIAKAKIPVLLLYGGADATVDPNTNCRRFARALKESGGVIEVVERGPYGHWPHGLELDEQQKFVDFFNGGGRTAEETALDRVRALKLPQAAFTAVRWHPADEKDADGKPSVFAGLGEVRFTAKPSPLSCIRCVVALPPPEKWDGRFQALGTIGAGGFEDLKKTAARARATGSATGYTDLATSQGIRSDGVLLDYGRRATHILATETKRIIEAFYGRQPKYSYYEGLSTGGQQGVAAAQFHPEDFDGIVATVPAMDRVPLHVYHAWSARQLVDKDGKVVFTDAQLAAVEQGGIDWFADKDEPYARGRFVTDSRWTPEAEDGVIACAIRREPSLDDPDLVRRLRNLFRGPTVNGRNVHPGIPFGSRIRYPWGVLFVTNPFLLTWYGLTITGFTDDDMARWMRDWGPSLDAMQTDLSRFKARGGKMVIVGGLADAGVPCGPMADWYEETARTMGGVDKLAECCRLYLVPGRDHCGEVTGISHVSVDIRAWVEKGVDPGVVQGTVRNGEQDERVPVQPYPLFTTGSAASGWGVKEFPRRPASHEASAGTSHGRSHCE